MAPSCGAAPTGGSASGLRRGRASSRPAPRLLRLPVTTTSRIPNPTRGGSALRSGRPAEAHCELQKGDGGLGRDGTRGGCAMLATSRGEAGEARRRRAKTHGTPPACHGPADAAGRPIAPSRRAGPAPPPHFPCGIASTIFDPFLHFVRWPRRTRDAKSEATVISVRLLPSTRRPHHHDTTKSCRSRSSAYLFSSRREAED
jgi:hypothetical protein